jgi:hypothetical protein
MLEGGAAIPPTEAESPLLRVLRDNVLRKVDREALRLPKPRGTCKLGGTPHEIEIMRHWIRHSHDAVVRALQKISGLERLSPDVLPATINRELGTAFTIAYGPCTGTRHSVAFDSRSIIDALLNAALFFEAESTTEWNYLRTTRGRRRAANVITRALLHAWGTSINPRHLQRILRLPRVVPVPMTLFDGRAVLLRCLMQPPRRRH